MPKSAASVDTKAVAKPAAAKNGASKAVAKATTKPAPAPAKSVAPPRAEAKAAEPAKPVNGKGITIKAAAAPVAAAPAPVPAKRGKTTVPKVSLGARTEPIRITISSDWKEPAKKADEPKASKNGNASNRFPQNAPVPLPPVPTNGKPKKNLAGLNAKDLDHFRELLLAKRRELVGDMSAMEREALRSANGTNLSNLPLHMADQGTDNYEQEFTLGLVEKDRALLREINRGLAKIQDGSYGICEGTGKPINKARLEAQPWAKYSIEHARMMERGLLRR